MAWLVSQHPVSVGPWASWPGLRGSMCPWVPGRPGLGSEALCAPGSLGSLAWAPRLHGWGGEHLGPPLEHPDPFTRSSSRVTGGHTVRSILTRPWWAQRQGQRQTCLLRGGG